MDITNKLKHHFCKNCGIPINLYEEPFFTERIKVLDKQYGSVEKYHKFLEYIECFKTEQDYYEFYNKVKDHVIEDIKSSPGFKRFNEMDMKEIDDVIKGYPFPSKSIYSPIFSNRSFISVDMKQANFTALHHYDSTIFDGGKTWEDYIRKFTNDEYLIESKFMRQAIFGNCNPKRQATYEKFLMCRMISLLLYEIPKENIVSLSNDEIIIDNKGYFYIIKEFVQAYSKHTGIEFRVESFELYDIGNDIGYLKSYDNMSYKLKCVDSDYIHMIIRLIEHGDIFSGDLYFYHKHELARLDKIPSSIKESTFLHHYYKKMWKYKFVKSTENFLKIRNRDFLTSDSLDDLAEFILKTKEME